MFPFGKNCFSDLSSSFRLVKSLSAFLFNLFFGFFTLPIQCEIRLSVFDQIQTSDFHLLGTMAYIRKFFSTRSPLHQNCGEPRVLKRWKTIIHNSWVVQPIITLIIVWGLELLINFASIWFSVENYVFHYFVQKYTKICFKYERFLKETEAQVAFLSTTYSL